VVSVNGEGSSIAADPTARTDRPPALPRGTFPVLDGAGHHDERRVRRRYRRQQYGPVRVAVGEVPALRVELAAGHGDRRRGAVALLDPAPVDVVAAPVRLVGEPGQVPAGSRVAAVAATRNPVSDAR
jgi:hypothetical protein